MGMSLSVAGTEWTITADEYKVIVDNSANNRGVIKELYIPNDSVTDLINGEDFSTFDFNGNSLRYFDADEMYCVLTENNSARIVVDVGYDVYRELGTSDPYTYFTFYITYEFYPDRICIMCRWYRDPTNVNNVDREFFFNLNHACSDPEYNVDGSGWINAPVGFTNMSMTSRLAIRPNGSSSTWCLGFMQYSDTEHNDFFQAGDYPDLRYDAGTTKYEINWNRDDADTGSRMFRLVLLPRAISDISSELDAYKLDFTTHSPAFTTGDGEADYLQWAIKTYGDSDGNEYSEGDTAEQIVADGNLLDFEVDGGTNNIKKLGLLCSELKLRTGTVGSPVDRVLGYWKCHDNAADTTVLATFGSNATAGVNTDTIDNENGLRATSGSRSLYLSIATTKHITLPANGCPTDNGTIQFRLGFRYNIGKNTAYYLLSTYKPGADNSQIKFYNITGSSLWRFSITDSAGTEHYKEYNYATLQAYCPGFDGDVADDPGSWALFTFTWNSTTPSMELWINNTKITADSSSVGSAWNASDLDWTNNRIRFGYSSNYNFPYRVCEITTLDGQLDMTTPDALTIDGDTVLIPKVKEEGTLKTKGTDYNIGYIGTLRYLVQLLNDITADDYQVQINDLYEEAAANVINLLKENNLGKNLLLKNIF